MPCPYFTFAEVQLFAALDRAAREHVGPVVVVSKRGIRLDLRALEKSKERVA